MNKVCKAILLASVCCLPISVQSMAAQESGANSADGEVDAVARLDTVIVSATKREETLQTVPVSVTAFSQDQLDLLGVSNLDGIQQSTPNLNFAAQSADSNVARVTLRGIGTETLVGGGDPGVALHVDGIYVGRNSVAALDVFDVERVEVLRGPQGTLFGRNATGGSVNILTKRPTDVLEGSADLTIGNYDAMRLRGVVNVPLSDSLSSRFTFLSDTHSGYVENLFDGGRDGAEKNVNSGRGQLLWTTDAGNEILARAYYTRITGAGGGARFLGSDITTANGYPGGYLVGVNSAPPGAPVVADVYGNATTARGDTILPRPTDLFDIRKDAPEFIDQTIKGIDLEATFDISEDLIFRSITSYQENENAILIDADNSELPIEERKRDSNASQISQEFNLLSDNDSAFQWLLGFYYYDEQLDENFELLTPAGLLDGTGVALPPGAVAGGGGVFQQRIVDHTSQSLALFGQGTYDLTDKLSVTLGVRHTWDEKEQNRTGGGLVDLTNNLRFRSGGATGSAPDDAGQVEFEEFSYKASADYQVTPDNMIYASFSRGYKTGGFDFNGGLVVGEDLEPYLPEFVDATEIGSKNSFFDGRAILNLALFNYDYTDLQVFRLTADGPRTDNAAASTIQGIEAEFQIALTDSLRIDSSVGYLDATYDEYTIDIPPTDFSGNRLNYAPEWTTHVGADYTIPVGDDDLTFRIDWSWRDDTFFDRANTELDTQEAYSLVNTRIRYDAHTWFADFFVNNLTDEEYVTGQLINPPFSCGCRTVNVGNPQTYGVTLGARF